MRIQTFAPRLIERVKRGYERKKEAIRKVKKNINEYFFRFEKKQ